MSILNKIDYPTDNQFGFRKGKSKEGGCQWFTMI